MLQTHYYDGKMTELVQSFQPVLSTISPLSRDVKISILKNLWATLENICADSNHLPLAKLHFDSIVNSIGRTENCDAINNVRAEDLLCLCSSFSANIDFCYSLVEQLHDISRGPCSQGRCTRILQLISSYSY